MLTAPQFKDNMHAFGVCYGLCLQGLGRGKLDVALKYKPGTENEAGIRVNRRMVEQLVIAPGEVGGRG